MTELTKQQRDSYRTPLYVFEWLNQRFNFTVDGCADEQNSLMCCYIGKEGMAENFLDFDHMDLISEMCDSNLRFFVNPPYSDVTPFLQRAKALRDLGFLVVVLLNNDKSTQWYQNHVHNVANEVIDIIGGRISFLHPVTKEEVKGNSKGQMVVVFDPAMNDFVQRSVSFDFIKTFAH
ncbi:adenine methyltransferase [Pasteurellaceae bacterium 15-036681]|nr:adenine methyltransferase [Pasteurellaceae bacterium 15-036681]